MISLRWFRDQGRGQEAAEHVGAEQRMDGAWPVAILDCGKDHYFADCRWRYLLSRFGVNAMTYQKEN